MIAALESSLWVKCSLYGFFSILLGAMVLNSEVGTIFQESRMQGAVFALVVAAMAMLMYHLSLGPGSGCHRNSRVVLVLGTCASHLLLVRLIMTMVQGEVIPELFRFLFVPFALAPMLLTILLGRGVGALATVTVSLAGAFFVPRDQVFGFIMISVVCGMTAVLLTHRVRKRVELLRAGILIGCVTLFMTILSGFLNIRACLDAGPIEGMQLIGSGSLAALGTAVFSALFISGLLPVFEGMFKLTTDISWLEQSDLNHKLLKRMQIEAPGTFHHSVVVASLAEAAAEKISANAPMCRVCAYFHDVGKLSKPGYFIENQIDGAENPHNNLTPTMSALIIVAHVKDGVDLAVKHKLNPRVIDVIQEHHGDSLVAYFYHKAREQKRLELEKIDRKLENPEDLSIVAEKSFRYPGPRPKTRESGIIALADTIESASRSLRKPTPGRIQALVEELVQAKIEDGQLDECPLTMQEITTIKRSFCDTLRSMLHSRIDYPKEVDGSRSTRTTGNGRRTPVPNADASRKSRRPDLQTPEAPETTGSGEPEKTKSTS
ncbi:MAG: HD family phosphohydrolase [Luteolibacter sp.]